MDQFEDLVRYARKELGARLAYKNESLLMKIISYLLFFVGGFMTHFTTVIGKTIYFPSREYIERGPESATRILSHELVHVYRGGVWFSVKYLFPQILSLFSLLALLAIWFSGYWLFWLAFLGFLAPLPAPYRVTEEVWGYAMNFSNSTGPPSKHCAKSIASADYYFPCGFANIEQKIYYLSNRIEATQVELLKNPTLKEIYFRSRYDQAI